MDYNRIDKQKLLDTFEPIVNKFVEILQKSHYPISQKQAEIALIAAASTFLSSLGHSIPSQIVLRAIYDVATNFIPITINVRDFFKGEPETKPFKVNAAIHVIANTVHKGLQGASEKSRENVRNDVKQLLQVFSFPPDSLRDIKVTRGSGELGKLQGGFFWSTVVPWAASALTGLFAPTILGGVGKLVKGGYYGIKSLLSDSKRASLTRFEDYFNNDPDWQAKMEYLDAGIQHVLPGLAMDLTKGYFANQAWEERKALVDAENKKILEDHELQKKEAFNKDLHLNFEEEVKKHNDMIDGAEQQFQEAYKRVKDLHENRGLWDKFWGSNTIQAYRYIKGAVPVKEWEDMVKRLYSDQPDLMKEKLERLKQIFPDSNLNNNSRDIDKVMGQLGRIILPTRGKMTVQEAMNTDMFTNFKKKFEESRMASKAEKATETLYNTGQAPTTPGNLIDPGSNTTPKAGEVKLDIPEFDDMKNSAEHKGEFPTTSADPKSDENHVYNYGYRHYTYVPRPKLEIAPLRPTMSMDHTLYGFSKAGETAMYNIAMKEKKKKEIGSINDVIAAMEQGSPSFRYPAGVNVMQAPLSGPVGHTRALNTVRVAANQPRKNVVNIPLHGISRSSARFGRRVL